MRTSLKITAGVLANLAMFSNSVIAYLPPIDFENYGNPGTPVDFFSPQPWEPILGDSQVSAEGAGFGGTGKALKILANSNEEAWLRKPVSWNAADTIAFIDFRIKPAATEAGSQANFYANGTQLAFQLPVGSTQGELWVLHGNDDDPDEVAEPETWYQSAGKFTVPTGASISQDWVRATLRHDYGRKVWDLFIDGKLAAVNLGFEGRGENLTHLEFFGSLAGDTLIDNLEASPSNMLFPDADNDGLPDAWEIANGSNPNLYDREAVKSGTGKSFLDHYLDSIWNVPDRAKSINGATGIGSIGTVPPLSILESHQPVGALKGVFAVGGDGAATYSMPIDVPKGRAGMEPKLSLNYSSNGGNGPMGVGWSLGGLQKITRGPSSLKKDGIADSVDFDANDRFYLDGERLVCISGIYGADGSEYRTEMDSFARIKAVGQNGSGPASWTIETKAGIKVTLGGTPDSRVEIGSHGVLSWLVNLVADTTGENAYRVEYCGDVGTTQPAAVSASNAASRYPWRIFYTVDPDAPADRGFCSMTFVYDETARKDVTSGYVMGVRQEANERLRRIEIRTGTGANPAADYLNHAYNLFYNVSQQTGRSLLYGVDKEAADGSRVPATSFQWESLSHSAPKWLEVGHLDFNEYGTEEDSGSSMASYVSVSETDPTEVHLTGNAWRTYPLQPALTVSAGTWLRFDYKTTAVEPKWGMIGLDENTSSASPKRLFKVAGGALPPESAYSDADWKYTNTGNWQTLSIPVGSKFTGVMNYLALVNDDNTVNDGVGESRFKNIRIYQGNPSLGGTLVRTITFEQALAVPQMLDGNNEDLGVRVQDLNGDGLPDIAYNLLHGKSSGTGAVTLETFGQALRNTGTDFVNDSGLRLPSAIPTGNLPSGGEGQFANSQGIYGAPIDINGDGQVDYAYAKSLTRESNGTFTCQHGYLTRVNNAWVELAGYAHHFKSNCATSQKRFSHFQHIDLDGDGDLDLIVHPYGATLTLLPGKPNTLPLASFPIVGNSGSNSGVAYLNKFSEGLGWVGSSDWRLPVPLRIPGFNSNGGEVGRSIQDLNGDGRPDLYSALWQANKNVWLNKDDASGWNPVDSGSIYQVPENLVSSNGDDVGTRLVDVNGDGRVDVIKALGSGSLNLQVGVSLNTGKGWASYSGPASPWLPEENFNTVDKRKEVQEQGTSFADLNADGLVDFVVSKPNINTVALNTGSTFWPESTRNPTNDTITHNPYWADSSATPVKPGQNAAGSWRLPSLIYPNTTASTNGIRHAMLVDLNGDGISDLIGNMKSPVPKIWINQAKPERIVSFTDGFAASIQVDTYARLNDPTPVTNTLGFNRRVYDKDPVSTLLPGQSSVCDSRWVVARYSEPDGMGGRRYRSQYYRDLRQDITNETSLGFGAVEVHDELSKGYSITQTRRDYPFAGSPDIVESYAYVGSAMAHQPSAPIGYRRVSLETATYGSLGETAGLGSINNAVHNVRRPVQLGSVAKKFDLDGTLMSHVVTSQAFDPHDVGFGFAKTSTVISQLDGSATATSNVYEHRIATGTSPKWQLGRLMSATVVKSAPGKATLTKSSSFTYHPTTGLLTSEKILPEAPDQALFVEKTYGHDAYGNVTSTSVRANKTLAPGAVEETRTSSTAYDSSGRFPVSETTPLGTTSQTYSHKRALLLSTTDLDDRETTFSYDTFGTKLATNHPDHTRSAEISRFVTNSDLPLSVSSKLGGGVVRWARSAQASATPWSTAYFDSLGREILKELVVMTGFNGTSATFANQYTVTIYDARGLKVKTSTPFLAGETPYWTTIHHDVLDRAFKTTKPDGTTEGIDTTPANVLMPGDSEPAEGVSGVKSVIVDDQPVSYIRSYNAKGSKLERWSDQNGRLIFSRDASGQLTAFNHDVEGRIISVAIDGEVQITNVFDKVGNKVSVTDLSGGTSTSSYNGFGEVLSATNPHGTVKTNYDSSGRVTSVTRPNEEASSPATVTFTTSYRGAKPGKGKPYSVDGPNGYQEVFTYGSATHNYGKLTSTAKRQKSLASVYVKTIDYNALGLVMSESFNGDASNGEDDVQVVHSYDNVFGSFETGTQIAGARASTLSQFVSVFLSGDRIIRTERLAHQVQRVTETDARNGRILQITSTRSGETLQNLSYTWDANGNLTSRTDSKSGKTETFQYDTDQKGLDRLGSSQIDNQSPVTYSYDPKGNLTGKGGNTNSYSGYRVTSATIKGQTRSYTYDSAGYVIADGKRIYTWTAFGQLKSVEQVSCPAIDTFAATGSYTSLPGIASSEIYSASEAKAQFEFDASGARATQSLVRKFSQSSEARVITRYNGSYELEEHATAPGGGSYQDVKKLHRHRLGNTLLTTEVPYQNGVPGPSINRLAVVLTDHIGSTDVIVRGEWQSSRWTVTSESTDLNNPRSERQSFDAWGQRRDGTAWSDLHPLHDSRRKASSMDHDRGFTGHEMLDDFGLVHMNGRIYDAELGRFLSPDPYVQVPEYSQNFNRYSYVLNNPLSLTDPSGFEISGLWAAIITIVVIVVVVCSFGTLTAPASSMGLFLLGETASVAVGGMATAAVGGAFLGGIAGGLNAALTGGDFGDVLRGGIVGGLQGGITAGLLHGMSPQVAGYEAGFNAKTALHVAGHGVVGGSANSAMGGKFQDGFISGAVSAAAADVGAFDFIEGTSGLAVAGRTAMAGIVGGTSSALGGGKFANGAFTSAFQHLLNQEGGKKIEALDPTFEKGITLNYHREAKQITYTNAKGELVTIKDVYSGNGEHMNKPSSEHVVDEGPIPAGRYLMGDAYQGGHSATDGGDNDWFKLYGSNGKGGYSEKVPVKDFENRRTVIRDGFNLHVGRASNGCVTVLAAQAMGAPGYPNSDQWKILKSDIMATEMFDRGSSKYRGWIIVK